MKRRKKTKKLLFWKTATPTSLVVQSVLVVIGGLFLLILGSYLSFSNLFSSWGNSIGTWWDNLILNSGGSDTAFVTHLIGGIFLIAGLVVGYLGAKSFWRRINRQSESSANKAGDIRGYLRQQQLMRGPRIVAIGGGTGLSTLLRGLKQHSSNITAIVTVTDDGGSSGRLVKDLGILPPGDLRNCLVALADAEKGMTDLFQHRFSGRAGNIGGHSVGNLLLAGLMEQAGGDIDHALELASNVLAIRGKVIPSTKDHIQLKATMENGEEITGETAIVDSKLKVRRIMLDPAFPRAHPEAVKAIHEADLICMGPGSVYTSVIPNLLVPGISDALLEAHASKVFICNVMTQTGESDNFTAAEHLVAIQANVPTKVFDYVLVNSEQPSQTAIDRYRLSGQEFVQPDIDRIRQMGYKSVAGNLINETDLVRHDPARLASRIMDILDK